MRILKIEEFKRNVWSIEKWNDKKRGLKSQPFSAEWHMENGIFLLTLSFTEDAQKIMPQGTGIH